MRKRWWLFLVAPPAFLLFIALGGWVVQLLWNWLVPTIIGWKAVTFWQAVGLLALCRILFGGFGGRGSHSHMRHRMAEKWDRMSPEERNRFREGMRSRFCRPHHEPAPPEA